MITRIRHEWNEAHKGLTLSRVSTRDTISVGLFDSCYDNLAYGEASVQDGASNPWRLSCVQWYTS